MPVQVVGSSVFREHFGVVSAGHTPVQRLVLEYWHHSNLWPAWLPQDTSPVHTTWQRVKQNDKVVHLNSLQNLTNDVFT